MPRILVVDDEPLVSMLVEDWLRELGCEVVGPARSVQQGLDFVGTAPLDGAILDVNLGGQNRWAMITGWAIPAYVPRISSGNDGWVIVRPRTCAS